MHASCLWTADAGETTYKMLKLSTTPAAPYTVADLPSLNIGPFTSTARGAAQPFGSCLNPVRILCV
jgi:hypothetical protein